MKKNKITVTIIDPQNRKYIIKDVDSRENLISWLEYIRAYEVIDYINQADEDADWTNDLTINLAQ